MKKFFFIALTVILLVQAAAPVCLAVSKDEDNGIIYYVWGNATENKSGDEPLNWLILDYGEVDGESGIKLVYNEGTGAYDPYYSMSKIDLNEYKYCSIRTYFESPDNRENVTSSFFVRYNGGSLYKNVQNPQNEWITEVLSFKKEDGTSSEWPDKAAGITWFRFNAKVKEGEAIYIRWIAFFKTREEAEAFNGFADISAYSNAVLSAKALKKTDYANYEVVQNALDEVKSVEKCVLASEQEKINAAAKRIQDAISQLISISDVHGDPIIPEVKTAVGTELDKNPTEPESETTVEQATEAEPTTIDSAETESTPSGCNGLIGAEALIVLFPLAVCTLKHRRDEE